MADAKVKIIAEAKVPLAERPFLKRFAAEPFMDGKYTAKITPNGSAVYDGDKLIASYGRGMSLVVHPDYRRQGIGFALALAWRRLCPNAPRPRITTEATLAIAEKVWAEIER